MYSGPYGICDLLAWTIESTTTSASYFSMMSCWLSPLVVNGQKNKSQWSKKLVRIYKQSCKMSPSITEASRTLHIIHMSNLSNGGTWGQFREEMKVTSCVLSWSHVWKWWQVTKECQNGDTCGWTVNQRPVKPRSWSKEEQELVSVASSLLWVRKIH